MMIGKWPEYRGCGGVMQPFSLDRNEGAAHVEAEIAHENRALSGT
jgi:hypothetical protein